MSEPFSFQAEWEAVDGSRGDEIRATWARFSLHVNGHPVTRVLDSRSGCYRDHILVPLYPVTEWIVRNWWSLLHEPEVTGDRDYPWRHNLRAGREGYALPALNIVAQGSQVMLQWQAENYGSIMFPSSGNAIVPMDDFRETLICWVEKVIGRLEESHVQDTLLQEEWQAIEQAPAEERAFCIAAAQAGLNPYTVSEAESNTIVEVADRLPETWHEDFFSALTVAHLQAGADYVLSLRECIQDAPLDLGPLGALRAKMRDLHSTLSVPSPWHAGYQAAALLREATGIGDSPLPTNQALAEALGMRDLPLITIDRHPRTHWLDAVTENSEERRGGIALPSRREIPTRFAFSRGLLELLTGDGTTSLVTAARTERQKRNRAFAAELLAPAHWLRKQDWGRVVEDEAIEEAAGELGVYSEVVRRQLVNHRVVEPEMYPGYLGVVGY